MQRRDAYICEMRHFYQFGFVYRFWIRRTWWEWVFLRSVSPFRPLDVVTWTDA